MNRVILLGRLTRDPEIRQAQNSDTTIARYTLAVDRRGKNEEGEQTADFISCICFNKAAEFVEKYLHQGSKIAIIGRLQTGSYTNKDGVKVYTTDVRVEEHEFVESKAAAGTASQSSSSPADNNGYMTAPAADDEGLPF